MVGCASEATLGVGLSLYPSKGLLIFLPWSMALVEIGEIVFHAPLKSGPELAVYVGRCAGGPV